MGRRSSRWWERRPNDVLQKEFGAVRSGACDVELWSFVRAQQQRAADLVMREFRWGMGLLLCAAVGWAVAVGAFGACGPVLGASGMWVVLMVLGLRHFIRRTTEIGQDAGGYLHALLARMTPAGFPAGTLLHPPLMEGPVSGLVWLGERTSAAQREIAFVLASDFEGTIGELLAMAEELATTPQRS